MESEKAKYSSKSIIEISKVIILTSFVLITASYFLKIYFENKSLKLENEQLIKKPEMPISISVRQAIIGAGLVAQITNHSDKFLAVVATFENPTMNQKKSFRLDLSPKSGKEVGHLEGWTFATGDKVLIKHNDYEALNKTIQ